MSDVDLIINVHTSGIKDITNLSAATRTLAQNLRGISVPMTKLDAHSRAVNKALGMTNRSMNDHAKSVKQLVANQKALAEETKRVQSNINSYRTAIAMAGGSHTKFGQELIGNQASLIKFGTTLRGLRIRAFGSDLQSVALKMQRIGKDAQFVGRSLMMNLTAPIMLFARLGFQSLVKIDEQLVRLTKVLEGVAMNADQARIKLGLMDGAIATPEQTKRINAMVDSFNKLESSLTELSNTFGVSKDLVVGLAVDFAELGITANDNIVSLTNMTLAAEKLGNMDASGAQDLTQALYFNSRRALEASGALDQLATSAERETRAIKAAQTQLYMFNTIENVTALSLKDLAQALPEVGSMAVSFGISMTEAAAMLAPMKAAGLDVGASANSIKISLQRVISPTKKTSDLLARLAKQYGVANDSQNAFNNTTKTGLAGLEAITEVFDKVASSSAGSEGALKLMSQIFEKRQGPRMLIAIEQLNNFNKELKGVNATARSQSAEGLMAITAEKALVKYNQLNNTALPTTINNFRDIGIVARIATATAGQMVEGFKGKGSLGAVTQKDIDTAKQVRGEVAKLVLDKKQLEGIDLIGQAKSESGRAMLVELAGASNAQDVANMELEQSLSSLSVTVQKIKNTFKNFAAELLKTVRPAVESIQKKLASFYKMWQGMSDSTKAAVSKTIVGFLGLLAALGPVVLALGTMQASVGVMGRGLAFFIPKLKNAEGGFIGLAKGAEKASSALKSLYSNYLEKKIPKTIIPAFASAHGEPSSMIGIPTRVGRNITLPGNVLPTPEALGSLRGISDPAERARIIAENRIISARNRAARLSHATAGRISVDQYARNEASMLSAKGMRLNSAGRVIFNRGGFVGGGINEKLAEASVLREAKLAEAGISRTLSGGTRLATESGFRDISEQRALKIARGGIAGSFARRTAALEGTGARLTAATGVSRSNLLQGLYNPMQGGRNIKGIATAAWNNGPVAAYTKSVKGAKDAVEKLKLSSLAMEGGAGKIKTMTTAMGGFMKATKLGEIGLKMMKATLITTGIGVALLAIGVAVMLVVKNFDQFKKAGKDAFAGLKNAWAIFKNAILELTRPIQDLFASFSKGGKEGKTAIGGVSVIFASLVKAIQFVAKVFKGFVNIVKPYLYAIVNIIAAVVALFQGNWKGALKFIVAAFAQAGIFLINIGKAAVKGLISVFFLFVKGVISYFTLIPKAFAKVMGFIAKHAGPFKGLFQGISDGVNGIVDGMFGLVDSAHNVINKGIDAVGSALTKGLKKGADLGIKESTNSLSGPGKTKLKDAGKDVGEATGEAIASGTGDGFDKADPTGAIGKKLTEGIKDAVQQLQDYVAGELKNAIEKYVDASVKAFEKQKASALKVFDVQLKTLSKLEKAEESLTRKKEYETNRRKLIDDKTLSDETFRRSYAMAIYEGRIDDARALQQQQKADQRNFNNDLLAIDDARAKDLAKENLDALKEAINEARDAASTFFDEAITKFQDSVAEITKFPPVTIEDYRTQIEKIYTITNETADKNTSSFQKMFEDFTTTINTKMPNDVVGAFTTNLDELVLVAKEKYGLGATAGENTVIGATIGMLADIGGKFGEGKQAVIDKFGEITTGFKDNFKTASIAIVKSVTDDFLTPFSEATTKFKENWKTVYEKAIIDGNQAITDSLRNNTAINKDLFDEMKSKISETTMKWLELKAAADAASEAQQTAANGGNPTGSTSSTNTTGTGAAAGGKADAFTTANALRVARGQLPLTYQQFINGTGLSTTSIVAATAKNVSDPIKNYTPAKGAVITPALAKTITNPFNVTGITGTSIYTGGINSSGGTGSSIYGPLLPASSPGFRGYKKGGIIQRASGGPVSGRSGNQNAGYPEGYIPAPTQEGVPALLHGGEYIINAKAVSRIGVGALNKLNNNLIPKFAKGGPVPKKNGSVVKANPASTRGTADAAERKIKTELSKPYDWKKDKSLDAVDRAIFKTSDFAIGAGKFGLGAAVSVGQNALRAGISVWNAVMGTAESIIPSKSQNPLTNIARRQNDLFYGTGASIPFVPRKYGQLTSVGNPVSVTWNQIGEYEKQTGKKLPAWKKVGASLLGDPAISDTIGIVSLGGGSFVNSAVKQATAKAATSVIGETLLTTALGEGGAAALTGTISSSASQAAAYRAGVVFSNKNFLGRMQSSYANIFGKDVVPVAPEFASLNNFYDPSGAIKQTFGKAPSTLIADVLNGRMPLPEGGFTPKFGSIGSGEFIDTTIAGGASSIDNSGLAILKNTIADYQVAKTLINSPTADVSAGINKTLLSSIGGKAAAGVKTFGSAFSNLGSSIRYSKPIQSALNAGSLTLAGLSGRKGLEYGLMATGFKPVPLGVSPSQLRDASWISSVIGPIGSSVFSAARRAPGILRSVESQFDNLSIFPGFAETGLIESPIDLFDTFINNNAGRFDSVRQELTQKGLNSFASNSTDYLYAKKLLKEDAYAMLQAYYGPNLQRFGSSQDVIDQLSNLLNQAIISHQASFAGSAPIASILRRDLFLQFIKEQDPSHFAFHANQLRGSTFNGNVIDTLTGNNRSASGLQGSFREVFRSMEERLINDPLNTSLDLASLIGTEKDMATRFSMQMPQYSAGGVFSNGIVTGGITDPYPPSGLLNPELSKIQKAAREYLLTSNLLGSPYLSFDIESILRKEFELPENATDLQDYAGDFGVMNSINPHSNSPYKSSLFLKSKISQAGTLSPNSPFGTLNELLVFDQVYDNLWNSWQLAVRALQGVDPQSTAFPLWSPTWEAFNEVWVSLLDDLVESTAIPSNGNLVMNPYLDITENLSTNPEAARNAIMEEVTHRMVGTSVGPGNLQGYLANLHLQTFSPNTGELMFSSHNLTDPSSNWFYGLRNGREMIAPGAFNPALTINEVLRDIANGNTVFYSMDPSAMSQRSVNAGYGAQINYPQPPPVDHTLQLESITRALKQKQDQISLEPPFDRQKLSELFRANASALDASLPSTQVWSGAPSSWSYLDEANIQSFLDNIPGAGKPSMGTPVPDGFPDVVRTILGQDSSEEYIKAVWLDFLKTKDIFFKGTADLQDLETFNMDVIAQNPFKEYEFNNILFQHGSPLVPLTFLNELINPSSNVNHILGGQLTAYTPKAQGTLEHFAGRMIAELKIKMMEITGGQSILLDPAVQSLDVDGMLKSRFFAEFFGIQNTAGIDGNPIDNVIANLPSNPFDAIESSAKILNTGSMFSSDIGFVPEEINWVTLFAEKVRDSGLDLDFRMPLPEPDPGAGSYTGLKIPSSPSDYVKFTNQKFGFKTKQIGEWLETMLSPYSRSFQSMGTGTTISRLRLDFLEALSAYLDGKNQLAGFYGDYFDSSINTSLLDPSVREKLEEINQIYLSTSSSLNRYPKEGMMAGSDTAVSTIYTRALLAANMIQKHRMAAVGVIANYSGNVSQYAQRIAEHSNPIAPLIVGGTNPISPFGQYTQTTGVADPYQLANLIAPSGLIEIIGLGIKKQGLIGSLLPESDVLGSSSGKGFLSPVEKRFLKFGVPKFKTGGYVPGAPSTAIPAILHGGEYVINADAVRNMGVRTMQSINQSKFRAPSGAPAYAGAGQTTNVSTVNINVDTFIGQEEWFKSMMKDYNINVLPKQQKAAGLESRTFTSYNGIQGF